MANIFKRGNEELIVLISEPSPGHLLAYFDARTSEWCEPLIYMECFTAGVFYDLAQSFEGFAAFQLLSDAASLDTDQMPDKKFMRFVDLIDDLSRGSNTTEMPAELNSIWQQLIDRAETIESGSVSLLSLKKRYANAR